MSFVDTSETLWSTVQSICADEGLDLYDLERSGPGALRITIDRAVTDSPTEVSEDGVAAQGGVSSGDCTKLCRRLVVFFAAEGPALGVGAEPEIEVSSPGINRALRLDRHWERAVGERVKVVFLEPRAAVSGGKPVAQTIGRLERFGAGELSVMDESLKQPFTVPKNAVKRAQIDFLFK